MAESLTPLKVYGGQVLNSYMLFQEVMIIAFFFKHQSTKLGMDLEK